MNLLRRIYLLAVLISSVSTLTAQEIDKPRFGMWSWQEQAYKTAEARSELLEFCKREGIVQVDQHLSIHLNQGEGVRAVKHQQALRDLLKEAALRRVKIYALRGEQDMFYARKHQQTLNELKAIIALNQSQPKGQRFAGVKYDVEPYLSKEWKAGGAARVKVMTDYLEFLIKARTMLKSKRSLMKLSVDVPFWWDEPKHALTFKGKTKPFTHHIQDLTDSIGIMSYRRRAEDVLKLSKDELNYAIKIRKVRSVSVGLETIEIKGEEAFISFSGQPVSNFRATVRELRKSLRTKNSANLIMLHDYRGLKRYLGTRK